MLSTTQPFMTVQTQSMTSTWVTSRMSPTAISKRQSTAATWLQSLHPMSTSRWKNPSTIPKRQSTSATRIQSSSVNKSYVCTKTGECYIITMGDTVYDFYRHIINDDPDIIAKGKTVGTSHLYIERGQVASQTAQQEIAHLQGYVPSTSSTSSTVGVGGCRSVLDVLSITPTGGVKHPRAGAAVYILVHRYICHICGSR